MAKEESDDAQISRKDWLAHEYTLQWSRSADRDAENAKKFLLSACSRSTDAEVRGAYNKWFELEVISVFMKTGAKK